MAYSSWCWDAEYECMYVPEHFSARCCTGLHRKLFHMYLLAGCFDFQCIVATVSSCELMGSITKSI